MEVDHGLAARMARRELAHAYVITGSQREELKDLLLAAYVCTGKGETVPCGDCPACRKARERIHPDLIRVEQTGASLGVEQIRALRADAYIRPNEARRKVYVLEHAENMTAAAQNAMLKLLEEGPPYAVFLFPVQNPELLLETVRSRCEILRAEDGEAPPGASADVEEDAQTLAGLLMDGSPLDFMEYSIGLETWDREKFAALLDRAVELLVAELPRRPGLLLPKIDRLREIRGACRFNVGVGHLAGWLAASLAQGET